MRVKESRKMRASVNAAALAFVSRGGRGWGEKEGHEEEARGSSGWGGRIKGGRGEQTWNLSGGQAKTMHPQNCREWFATSVTSSGECKHNTYFLNAIVKWMSGC